MLVAVLKFREVVFLPPRIKIQAVAMPVDKEKDGEIFICSLKRFFRKLDLSRGLGGK